MTNIIIINKKNKSLVNFNYLTYICSNEKHE